MGSEDFGAGCSATCRVPGVAACFISLQCCSGASEEDPWASKTSVLAALREAGPMRAKRPHAEHDAEDPMRGMAPGGDDEDPLLSMGAERKAKKAKKEKKEKKKHDKDKKKKQVRVQQYTSHSPNATLSLTFSAHSPAWCNAVPAGHAIPFACWRLAGSNTFGWL